MTADVAGADKSLHVRCLGMTQTSDKNLDFLIYRPQAALISLGVDSRNCGFLAWSCDDAVSRIRCRHRERRRPLVDFLKQSDENIDRCCARAPFAIWNPETLRHDSK